jgi:hypothetical protein
MWLPVKAGRMWLPVKLARIPAPHAAFRLKPEATSLSIDQHDPRALFDAFDDELAIVG